MDDQLSEWPPARPATDRARRTRAAWISAAGLGGGLVGSIVWAPFLGPLAGLVAVLALLLAAVATVACAAEPTAAPPALQAVAAGTRRVAVVLAGVVSVLAATAVFRAMSADPGVAILVGAALALVGVGGRELARLT